MARISMARIAELAGVSIGTVDRVLHNRGHVAEEKEKIVRAICQKYGYEANVIGKAMSLQRKPHRIAVAVNNPDMNSFCASVHSGLREGCDKLSDYNIQTDFYDFQEISEKEQLHHIFLPQ